MNILLFGTVPSPGCDNFCLKIVADNYEDDISNFLRDDFYVDDGLKSVASVGMMPLATKSGNVQQKRLR